MPYSPIGILGGWVKQNTQNPHDTLGGWFKKGNTNPLDKRGPWHKSKNTDMVDVKCEDNVRVMGSRLQSIKGFD